MYGKTKKKKEPEDYIVQSPSIFLFSKIEQFIIKLDYKNPQLKRKQDEIAHCFYRFDVVSCLVLYYTSHSDSHLCLFLGWISRTQFEETWATLLGVLVTQPIVMDQEENQQEVMLLTECFLDEIFRWN